MGVQWWGDATTLHGLGGGTKLFVSSQLPPCAFSTHFSQKCVSIYKRLSLHTPTYVWHTSLRTRVSPKSRRTCCELSRVALGFYARLFVTFLLWFPQVCGIWVVNVWIISKTTSIFKKCAAPNIFFSIILSRQLQWFTACSTHHDFFFIGLGKQFLNMLE